MPPGAKTAPPRPGIRQLNTLREPWRGGRPEKPAGPRHVLARSLTLRDGAAFLASGLLRAITILVPGEYGP